MWSCWFFGGTGQGPRELWWFWPMGTSWSMMTYCQHFRSVDNVRRAGWNWKNIKAAIKCRNLNLFHSMWKCSMHLEEVCTEIILYWLSKKSNKKSDPVTILIHSMIANIMKRKEILTAQRLIQANKFPNTLQ